jgi:hypothetical protein
VLASTAGVENVDLCGPIECLLVNIQVSAILP